MKPSEFSDMGMILDEDFGNLDGAGRQKVYSRYRAESLVNWVLASSRS